MKNLTVILLLFCLQIQAQDLFITGELPFEDGTKVSMHHVGYRNETLTTATIHNGAFELRMDSEWPGEYILSLSYPTNEKERFSRFRNSDHEIITRESERRGFLKRFYLDPRQATHYHLQPAQSLDLETAKESDRSVLLNSMKYRMMAKSDSEDSQVYDKLDALSAWLYDQRNRIQDSLYRMGDQKDRLPTDYRAATDSILERYWIPIQAEKARQIFRAHPHVPTSAYALLKYPNSILQSAGKEYEELIALVPPTAKQHPLHKSAAAKLTSVLYLNPGDHLPEPNGRTPSGNEFKFRTAEYAYTLVEFWASWCVPCREQNPAWNALLDRFGKDGQLQIVGVSLDTEQDDWLTAIKYDQLNLWKHVSDLTHPYHGINGTRYGIESIPFNILVDQQGNIVQKNIKPGELETLLYANYDREFEYSITGFSDRIADGKTIYLIRSDLINIYANDLLDSAIVRNGRFTLSGTTIERSYVILKSGNEIITPYYFILDQSPISVDHRDGVTTIIGGEEQRLMDSIKGLFATVDRVRRSVSDSMNHYASLGQPLMEEYFRELYGKVYAQNVDFRDRVFAANPKNFSSFYALQYAIGMMSDKNAEDNQDFYSRLSPELKATSYGKTIGSYIYRDTLSMFTNITGHVDTSGNSFEYSFPAEGYTLIDFWASWCGPCRANVPILKDLYKKYRRSGLEIIGVTIDDSESAWKQAVLQDGSPWINVAEYLDNTFQFPGLELQGRINSLAVYSGSLYAVPQYFLLDPQGKIVLRTHDVEEVVDKISIILKI